MGLLDRYLPGNRSKCIDLKSRETQRPAASRASAQQNLGHGMKMFATRSAHSPAWRLTKTQSFVAPLGSGRRDEYFVHRGSCAVSPQQYNDRCLVWLFPGCPDLVPNAVILRLLRHETVYWYPEKQPRKRLQVCASSQWRLWVSVVPQRASCMRRLTGNSRLYDGISSMLSRAGMQSGPGVTTQVRALSEMVSILDS